MSQPYESLPPFAFWRSAVAEANPFAPQDLYRKKFDLSPDDKIAAAGSCFAQHISRRLRGCGYSVLDVEPAPRGLPSQRHLDYGYSMYSARSGNI